MGTITTNAIVLRHAPYRENDRMLTLFSPTMGRVDVLCRGCRKQRSPLMACSELFCAGEYVLYQSRERLGVQSCQVQDSFYPLREDVDRLTHGAMYLELCEAVVQPGQESERLFLFLLRTLAHLSYGAASPERISTVFLMGFLSLTGFRPEVRGCVRCGAALPQAGKLAAFSPGADGLLCTSCAMQEAPHAPRVDARGVTALQKIMKSGLETLKETEDAPPGVLSALLAYAQAHVERQLRSVKLLEALYTAQPANQESMEVRQKTEDDSHGD